MDEFSLHFLSSLETKVTGSKDYYLFIVFFKGKTNGWLLEIDNGIGKTSLTRVSEWNQQVVEARVVCPSIGRWFKAGSSSRPNRPKHETKLKKKKNLNYSYSHRWCRDVVKQSGAKWSKRLSEGKGTMKRKKKYGDRWIVESSRNQVRRTTEVANRLASLELTLSLPSPSRFPLLLFPDTHTHNNGEWGGQP